LKYAILTLNSRDLFFVLDCENHPKTHNSISWRKFHCASWLLLCICWAQLQRHLLIISINIQSPNVTIHMHKNSQAMDRGLAFKSLTFYNINFIYQLFFFCRRAIIFAYSTLPTSLRTSNKYSWAILKLYWWMHNIYCECCRFKLEIFIYMY